MNDITKSNRNKKIYSLRKAGKSFADIASKLKLSMSIVKQIYSEEKKKRDDPASVLEKMLPTRIQNNLIQHFGKNHPFPTPDQLMEFSLHNLLEIKNFGRNSLKQVADALHELGYISDVEMQIKFNPKEPIRFRTIKKKKQRTGYGKPGVPTKSKRNHLGKQLLEKYEGHVLSGFEDLEQFELIDQLKKPVLNFSFSGTKKQMIELHNYLAGFPYAFLFKLHSGLDLWQLKEAGVRNAQVYISRFPKLLAFIDENQNDISNDLWGLIYGYPLDEVHQYTYDWETWDKKKENEREDLEINREEHIYRLRQEGETFTSIAKKFGISIQRAREIYYEEKDFVENHESWPILKRKLPLKVEKALVSYFGTEDILNEPQKLIDFGIKNLAKIKNIGKYSVRDIVYALWHLGYIDENERDNCISK